MSVMKALLSALVVTLGIASAKVFPDYSFTYVGEGVCTHDELVFPIAQLKGLDDESCEIACEQIPSCVGYNRQRLPLCPSPTFTSGDGFCCHPECTQCGGSGCWKGMGDGGSSNCCHSAIKKSERLCLMDEPPCRLPEDSEVKRCILSLNSKKDDIIPPPPPIAKGVKLEWVQDTLSLPINWQFDEVTSATGYTRHAKFPAFECWKNGVSNTEPDIQHPEGEIPSDLGNGTVPTEKTEKTYIGGDGPVPAWALVIYTLLGLCVLGTLAWVVNLCTHAPKQFQQEERYYKIYAGFLSISLSLCISSLVSAYIETLPFDFRYLLYATFGLGIALFGFSTAWASYEIYYFKLTERFIVRVKNMSTKKCSEASAFMTQSVSDLKKTFHLDENVTLYYGDRPLNDSDTLRKAGIPRTVSGEPPCITYTTGGPRPQVVQPAGHTVPAVVTVEYDEADEIGAIRRLKSKPVTMRISSHESTQDFLANASVAFESVQSDVASYLEDGAGWIITVKKPASNRVKKYPSSSEELPFQFVSDLEESCEPIIINITEGDESPVYFY